MSSATGLFDVNEIVPTDIIAPVSTTIKNKWGKNGTRNDGTKKGTGFLGVRKMTDGSNRDMTEFAYGFEVNGKEVEMPALIPTLTDDELNHLLSGKKATPEILRKAYEHGVGRIKEGKNPFIQDDEYLFRRKDD
jgi:hypothetical protein